MLNSGCPRMFEIYWYITKILYKVFVKKSYIKLKINWPNFSYICSIYPFLVTWHINNINYFKPRFYSARNNDKTSFDADVSIFSLHVHQWNKLIEGNRFLKFCMMRDLKSWPKVYNVTFLFSKCYNYINYKKFFEKKIEIFLRK